MEALLTFALIVFLIALARKNSTNKNNSSLPYIDVPQYDETSSNYAGIDGKYYGYFEEYTDSTTQQVQAELERKRSLDEITYLYLNKIDELERQIDILENLIEQKEKNGEDDDTKASLICRLQPLYEKFSIAQRYYDYEYFDKDWLLRRVYNRGNFLLPEDLDKLRRDMLDYKLENDQEYKRKEHLVSVLTAVIAFGVPALGMLLPIISFVIITLSVFFHSEPGPIVSWFVFTYPFMVWLPFLSWGLPLLCWLIIPPILRIAILGDECTTEKKMKDKEFDRNARIAFGVTVAGLASAMFSKKGSRRRR